MASQLKRRPNSLSWHLRPLLCNLNPPPSQSHFPLFPQSGLLSVPWRNCVFTHCLPLPPLGPLPQMPFHPSLLVRMTAILPGSAQVHPPPESLPLHPPSSLGCPCGLSFILFPYSSLIPGGLRGGWSLNHVYASHSASLGPALYCYCTELSYEWH